MSGVVEKKWLRIAPCESIPAREGRLVDVAGQQIAVFNLGDRFLAVESRCPHRGGPLADGIVSGTSVVCPLHAWKFDLLTGNSVNHPESGACLNTFPTRTEDGIICIELPLEWQAGEQAVPACERHDRPIRWVARKPLTGALLVQQRAAPPQGR